MISAVQEVPTGNKAYEVRTTGLTVAPPREPLFSQVATRLSIEDEAAGELVKVTQQSACNDMPIQQILIDPKEWPSLRSAIDYLVSQCRKEIV